MIIAGCDISVLISSALKVNKFYLVKKALWAVNYFRKFAAIIGSFKTSLYGSLIVPLRGILKFSTWAHFYKKMHSKILTFISEMYTSFIIEFITRRIELQIRILRVDICSSLVQFKSTLNVFCVCQHNLSTWK